MLLSNWYFNFRQICLHATICMSSLFKTQKGCDMVGEVGTCVTTHYMYFVYWNIRDYKEDLQWLKITSSMCIYIKNI